MAGTHRAGVVAQPVEPALRPEHRRGIEDVRAAVSRSDADEGDTALAQRTTRGRRRLDRIRGLFVHPGSLLGRNVLRVPRAQVALLAQ